MIATRESRLALWQAEHVKALLEARGHSVTLLGMTTLGDQILDRSLSKVGGKGLFVKELEVALEEGRADIAVHSLKDVPMDLPEGFALACVMEREDPRDAWVSSQLRQRWPTCRRARWSAPPACAAWCCCARCAPTCGSNPCAATSTPGLRKLDEGQYDGIVLAAAGLKRLGLGERIRHVFEPTEMLPAAGQGALGIEVRADRADLLAALAPLVHTDHLAGRDRRARRQSGHGRQLLHAAGCLRYAGRWLHPLECGLGRPRGQYGAGHRARRDSCGRSFQCRRTGRTGCRPVARARRALRQFCALTGQILQSEFRHAGYHDAHKFRAGQPGAGHAARP